MHSIQVQVEAGPVAGALACVDGCFFGPDVKQSKRLEFTPVRLFHAYNTSLLHNAPGECLRSFSGLNEVRKIRTRFFLHVILIIILI